MTDLGETTTYLGLEVSRDRANKTLTLCQSRYIADVVTRFGMAGCNAVTTPLPPSSQLVPFEGTASTSARSAYQQIIGSLMYAAIVSRPDIAFAVNSLARYAANPAPEHLAATKHVLRYLAGTTTLGLRYNGARDANITAHSDSDWAASLADRRSTGAFVFFLCGAAISWSSRRQRVVSLSSTEAEYIALSQAAVQATWYRNITDELRVPLPLPLTLFGDNKGSIDLANNPIVGKGTKHISIKFHFIRQCVEEGLVSLRRLPSAAVIADALTKPLPRATLELQRNALGLVNLTTPNEGGC